MYLRIGKHRIPETGGHEILSGIIEPMWFIPISQRLNLQILFYNTEDLTAGERKVLEGCCRRNDV